MELPNLYVVGKLKKLEKHERTTSNNVYKLWTESLNTKMFTSLSALSTYTNDYVGFLTDFDDVNNVYSYIIGMLVYGNNYEIPKGYSIKKLEGSKIAHSYIKASSPREAHIKSYLLTKHVAEAAGYPVNNVTWHLESYNKKRYLKRDKDGDLTLDFYIPLNKE
jgi:predicted transcriptional regulator YdeE